MVTAALAQLAAYEREPFALVDERGAPTIEGQGLAKASMEALLVGLSGQCCCLAGVPCRCALQLPQCCWHVRRGDTPASLLGRRLPRAAWPPLTSDPPSHPAGLAYQLPCRQYVLATLQLPDCTTCPERGCRVEDCRGNILVAVEEGGWKIVAPHHKRAGK